jgi:hypothetical protein
MHRRLHPKPHEFVYRIFLFLLDLDEIPSFARAVPIFSVEEPNLYSLRNEDYFQFHSRGLRANFETFLQTQNISARPARIRLLTLPRMLGYTFNPISIFFCFDSENRPLTSVVQVGNTFGETFTEELADLRRHLRRRLDLERIAHGLCCRVRHGPGRRQDTWRPDRDAGSEALHREPADVLCCGKRLGARSLQALREPLDREPTDRSERSGR